MSRNTGKRKKHFPYEIELDEPETASSETDFSDFYYADDSEDADDEHILSIINIKENPDIGDDPSYPDVHIPDSEDPFVHTELVLKFHHAILPDALKWFLDRVTAKKSRGGAELLIKREPYFGMKKEGLVVHVTAAGWRQLEVAEMLGIKKMDYSREVPIPREFKVREVGRFLREDMEMHEVLSSAEKQIVVMHELAHVLCRPGESFVPGYRHMLLRTGQPIFHVFTHYRLISHYFPLHEEVELSKLGGERLKIFMDYFNPHPYDEIRSYFGDKVCLYFNFLAYYTKWLFAIALIGLILGLAMLAPSFKLQYQHVVQIFFGVINILFVSLFLINWQRESYLLTFNWGTLKMNNWEEPRANYEGVLGLDPVTGALERKYPYYKTLLKIAASTLVVVASLVASIWVLQVYLRMDGTAKEKVATSRLMNQENENGILSLYVYPYIPGMVYAVIVVVANKLYRKLANMLTEWENHRTQTQFERHLVFKMVVFEVVNNFGILFYTAFILQDTEVLRNRLFTMLLVIQALTILDACFVPLIFRTGHAKMTEFLDRNRLTMLGFDKFGNFLTESSSVFLQHRKPRPYPNLDDSELETMDGTDPRVEISKVEEKMYPYDYEADFDDYLQLFLQFGYIFLFSSVYPLAAVWGFVCNLALLYSTLYKLRLLHQRPLAMRARGIGAWQVAFDFIGLVSVITNCALLCMNKDLKEMTWSYSDVWWIVTFVLIEHAVLFCQYILRKVIPKLPYKVQVALAAYEYRSSEAFKKEQVARTRRRMTRMYRPINEKLLDKPGSSRDKGSDRNQQPQSTQTGSDGASRRSKQSSSGGASGSGAAAKKRQ